MAGDWIKVETGLPEKPEVLKVARLLSLHRDQVVGTMVRFWAWVGANSVDGSVTHAALRDIDDVVGCQGFAAAMKTVGWIVEDGNNSLKVPNFDRHNGEGSKKRALTAARQRRFRNADVDASVTQVALPEKRREEKKHRQEKFVLPSWIPDEPWKAWLEVRDKKRIPNTQRSLQLAVKELDRLRGEGNDPRAVLETATLKGWRGLFPVHREAAAAPFKVDA